MKVKPRDYLGDQTPHERSILNRKIAVDWIYRFQRALRFRCTVLKARRNCGCSKNAGHGRILSPSPPRQAPDNACCRRQYAVPVRTSDQ
jgi:hypothetical protein